MFSNTNRGFLKCSSSLPSESVKAAAAVSGGAMTGTIDLHGCGATADLTGGVHLLPCRVKLDGPAPVYHYFKPRASGHVIDGVEGKEAFFRGRKLEGASVCFPDGYCGYVLEKMQTGEEMKRSDGGLNSWVSRAQFKNFTYWNHDSMPSMDDPIPRCFQWFSVANALHKPVTAEELTLTLAAQNIGDEGTYRSRNDVGLLLEVIRM